MAFGLLTYSGTDNLGDEMQSLAAKQFLPRVDYLLDREQLNDLPALPGETINAVLNGWYCWNPERWPPSQQIRPLLVSMHLAKIGLADGRTAREVLLSGKALDYLKTHGPVGARDQSTLDALHGAGVDAYWSACLTLTLERPPVERDPTLIVLNDLPQEISQKLWNLDGRNVLHTKHAGWPEPNKSKRMHLAQHLLDTYARASCVITTRLHCALPCLAIGTPVMLVRMTHEPERFDSLAEFTHSCTFAEFLEGRTPWSVYEPKPNPERHLPYRARLIESVRKFIAYQ